MIYSNKTHLIINVIGLPQMILHEQEPNCTHHWQNINSITTGVASNNCDIFGKPIYKL